MKFDVFVGGCNGEVVVEFLKRLMHDAGPVFLILDNASFRKVAVVKEYVASPEGKLKLFFPPPGGVLTRAQSRRAGGKT